MFRDERLEMKVGLFIGIGMFLMFLIVFTIKQDETFVGKGYDIFARFDYVNGITESAPVRLAGVGIGDVKKIELYHDDTVGKTRVKVTMKIREGVRIADDSIVRINTLGLLGERYLEITPGTSAAHVPAGSAMISVNPLNVGLQMQRFDEMATTINTVIGKAGKGEGTIGKLLNDDVLYNDMKTVFEGLKNGQGTLGKLLKDDTLYTNMSDIFVRINSGEGTLGKFLTDDAVYNDVKDFSADIKAHPWKLISKPREARDARPEKDQRSGKNFK
jgi:phospholipid/cholesterol/gamma-HCH transport system substrate-binding protein